MKKSAVMRWGKEKETTMALVNDISLFDVIRRNAKIFAEREALVYKDARYTHRQLKERCDLIATGLVRRGVVKGDRLAVMAHNSDEYLFLFGAAAKIGAIMLLVNWRLKQDELAYILNDGKPKFVFAGQEFQTLVLEAVQDMDFVQEVYSIGGDPTAQNVISFSELFRREGSTQEFELTSDCGVAIVHTAAIDGQQKGALLTHSSMLHANLNYMYELKLSPEDCHMCILPLFHTAALCWTMAVMHAGGKTVILEHFEPHQALSLIEAEKGSLFFHFAPVLQRLMECVEQDSYDLKSLRYFMGIDSPANIKRFQKAVPNAKGMVGYGQTETMVFSLCAFDERPGSMGRPCALARVSIRDGSDHQVPDNQVGELCVRSPMNFGGYWEREEDTAFTFRNGWLHTGDLGRFDQDGYLWYMGRAEQRDLIKPGGENVFPVEVEAVINQHPLIAETCVIGVPDQEWGEAIKAVCVLHDDAELDGQDLIKFVSERIASYKKPKLVVFVDQLPKRPSGEVDREQVKQSYGFASE